MPQKTSNYTQKVLPNIEMRRPEEVLEKITALSSRRARLQGFLEVPADTVQPTKMKRGVAARSRRKQSL
jgi:hypothetical protein